MAPKWRLNLPWSSTISLLLGALLFLEVENCVLFCGWLEVGEWRLEVGGCIVCCGEHFVGDVLVVRVIVMTRLSSLNLFGILLLSLLQILLKFFNFEEYLTYFLTIRFFYFLISNSYLFLFNVQYDCYYLT